MTFETWLFTFGVGSPYARRYVEIHGTREGARLCMMRAHGTAWAFQYRGDQYETKVKPHGLTALSHLDASEADEEIAARIESDGD